MGSGELDYSVRCVQASPGVWLVFRLASPCRGFLGRVKREAGGWGAQPALGSSWQWGLTSRSAAIAVLERALEGA